MRKKLFPLFLFLLIFAMIPMNVAFATETTTTTTGPSAISPSDPLDPGIPVVTTDDVNNWVDSKGAEIVSILQRFAQPFSIIMFIFCAFMTLVGAFGNPKLISRGVRGMLIAVAVYALVINAPLIVDTLMNFFIS